MDDKWDNTCNICLFLIFFFFLAWIDKIYTLVAAANSSQTRIPRGKGPYTVGCTDLMFDYTNEVMPLLSLYFNSDCFLWSLESLETFSCPYLREKFYHLCDFIWSLFYLNHSSVHCYPLINSTSPLFSSFVRVWSKYVFTQKALLLS